MCRTCTADAGFNVVLTALMYVTFVAGSFWVITRHTTSLTIGFLIGVGTMMCLTSLMTAVYWGQLSDCSPKLSGTVRQYTCNHVSAMRSVCAFASLLFIAEGAFTAMLVAWKDEFTDDEPPTGGYSDIAPNPGGAAPYAYDASKAPAYDPAGGEAGSYGYDASAGYGQSSTADL